MLVAGAGVIGQLAPGGIALGLGDPNVATAHGLARLLQHDIARIRHSAVSQRLPIR